MTAYYRTSSVFSDDAKSAFFCVNFGNDEVIYLGELLSFSSDFSTCDRISW